MATKKSKEALLAIWSRRLVRRKAKLARLLKAPKINRKKIERAEYQVLIANKKVKALKKKVGGKKLSVRKPKIEVNRIREGNVHGRLTPSVVVLHSTESHDRPGTSDISGVLGYLERTPEALGIHYVIDKEGNVGQGARINQMVYHARGANSIGIGIENIGFAHHTHWNREDRTPQIDELARILAYLSKDRGIPLKHSTKHGIAKHSDFPAGGHSDPGSTFPMKRVLKLAKKYRKSGW